MEYIKVDGSNNHLIITLHGTGGSADSLFEVAQTIDPQATKVGFLGKVNENGMSRYFARYASGGFDLESLKKATDDLNDSITKLIKDFKLEKYIITILGYSNGANLAKNLLKEYANVKVDNALLFHPSPITPSIGYKPQKNINVLMTSGVNDPYVSEVEFNALKTQMQTDGIKVETFTHKLGHQLIQEELEYAKNFLLKTVKENDYDKD